MNTKRWNVLGILSLLLVAVGAYFWATAMMDSLTGYRSPLAATPPEPGPALGEPLTRRVVILLVDALREDTALDADLMPFLEELRQQGAWATMRSRPPSYSAPGWATLLTGAWPDLNDGQSANPPDENSVRTFTQDDIFAAAERSGLRTAVSGYAWFEAMLANSGLDDGFYTSGEDHTADISVMDAALPWLDSGDYQLALIHLDQVDYAGHHEGGPLDPRWKSAAKRVDIMLSAIVSSLDLGQDTVIVLSDHGQIDRGGHGGQDPVTLVEPFVMAGAGVIPGRYTDIQMVDVAPTIAALLGTNIPASNQGHVLTDMLSIPSTETFDHITETLNTQQKTLADAYQKAIGYSVTSDPGERDIVEYHQALIEKAHSIRLKNERNPRFLIALILALIPAVISTLKRSRKLAWLLGGAALYLVTFNAIYALIVGKTYSLSSVLSANDLVISTAIYAGASLLVAWLVTMFGQQAFSSTPAAAAQTSLALTFVTLYLLALPVLWNYYINGPLITWTLPEFSSMFLGFLSIAQALFVAMIGLLLTGIAALVAKLAHRQ